MRACITCSWPPPPPPAPSSPPSSLPTATLRSGLVVQMELKRAAMLVASGGPFLGTSKPQWLIITPWLFTIDKSWQLVRTAVAALLESIFFSLWEVPWSWCRESGSEKRLQHKELLRERGWAVFRLAEAGGAVLDVLGRCWVSSSKLRCAWLLKVKALEFGVAGLDPEP